MTIITRLDECMARRIIGLKIKQAEEFNADKPQEDIDKVTKMMVKAFKNSDEYKNMSKEDVRKHEAICRKKFSDEQIEKRNFFLIGDEGTPSKKKILFGYHNGVYIPEGEDFIAQDYELLFSNEDTNADTMVINKTTEAIRRVVYNPDKLDLITTKNIICLENCCFNLNERKFEPHNPDYVLINKYPIVYDEKAKISNNALKFFNDLCNNDAKKLEIMQKFMGSIFLTDTRYKVFMMGHGGKDSGKSTFTTFLKALFKKKNVSNIRLHQLKNDKFVFSGFYGKTLNISSEATSNEVNNTAVANIKILLGGDSISTQKKFKDPFDFENEANLMIICNTLPEINTIEEAFWGKMLLFKFSATFDHSKTQEEVISQITKKEEVSGIFNWCLEGLYKLQNEGGFKLDASKVEGTYYTLTHEATAISVFNFIAEKITTSIEHSLTKKEVHTEYIEFCKEESEECISDIEQFNKTFKNICMNNGIELDAKIRPVIDGKREAGWGYIDFKNE